ncbi:hypothetical protein [Paenarthrobacter nitroguajacolicus]|uniref:hypothetical protein n=1 Tax=Paenarthrobacter nitroguajacolicus TaxID=211146 RepID=UPI004054963B
MASRLWPSAGTMTATLALVAGLLVAAVLTVTSRFQLADGGSGVLLMTVPVPAVIVLLVAVVSASVTGSFRSGLMAGFSALVASFIALAAMLALEGLTWMEHRGVFMLDGDPPRGPVDPADVAVNLFTTGMWIGHVVVWVPGVILGAAIGAWIGARKAQPGEVRPLTT